MSINFFDTRCQEPPITALSFGICDNQDGTKAYTDILDATTWVAKVENPEAKAIIFTAIDGCIEVLRANGDMERRCDGMMTYTENIVFVELKEAERKWISDAIEQLEITIQHFRANYDLNLFKHKRAFTCNKKRPKFEIIAPETKRRFFDTYRVRLNVQAVIKV